MGIKKQNESDKLTGDKYESTVDRLSGGPGKRGEAEPDEEGEEVEREEDDDGPEDAEDE